MEVKGRKRMGTTVRWGLKEAGSGQLIAKSVSIKDAGGKSGGPVSKAVELIAGDLLHVSDSGLSVE
jgi:hypothetical protein